MCCNYKVSCMLMTAICNTKSLRQVTDLLLVVTGRMMCSKGCKDISDGMHSLVQESRAKGAIRLPSPDYPPGFAVTFTAGLDTNDDSQTDTVLPAAENLLPSFAHDYQELASFGTVPLVKSFICRTHRSGITTRPTQLCCSAVCPAMGLSTSRCGLRLRQPAGSCAEFGNCT